MLWTDIYKELAEVIIRKNEYLASIPDEYAELRERLMAVPDVQHIDLWHEQVNYLTEEHSFPCPAVFFEFNTLGVDDNGKLVQLLNTQVDLHVFWETFDDTYVGAVMQEEALQFMDLLTLLNMLFHGRSGTHFNTLRKTGISREETGGAGNLYRITFECQVHDYSAQELYAAGALAGGITVSDEKIPDHPQEDNPMYVI